MIALALCLLAFSVAYFASRRSLVTGLGAVLTIGYFYGIVRANVTHALSHFVFDAAVLGLYAVHLFRPLGSAERARLRVLRPWLALMVAWPLLLFLLPIQTYPVQAVGLRGSVFLVPFLLLGARLTYEDVKHLAFWCAGLNIVAFGFAVAEFLYGVELFFPRSAVTEIIYRSRSIDTQAALRIPATFANAHGYAGVMVMTLPLLVGTWVERRDLTWQRVLLIAAILSACIGVFMAATRMHAILFFFLLLVTSLSRRVGLRSRAAWSIVIVIVAVVVAQNERLQRFRTLEDIDYVAERVQGSVNETFLELAAEFPLGNGLGGGGTSMPYFLQVQIRDPRVLENEYARIMLEQGIPGLAIWVAFLLWIVVRRGPRAGGGMPVTRRLAWYACVANFATGLIGTGLLASIPLTALLLLMTGWNSTALAVASGGIPVPPRDSAPRRLPQPAAT